MSVCRHELGVQLPKLHGNSNPGCNGNRNQSIADSALQKRQHAIPCTPIPLGGKENGEDKDGERMERLEGKGQEWEENWGHWSGGKRREGGNEREMQGEENVIIIAMTILISEYHSQKCFASS